MDLGQFIIQNFHEFLTYTAFANATVGQVLGDDHVTRRRHGKKLRESFHNSNNNSL